MFRMAGPLSIVHGAGVLTKRWFGLFLEKYTVYLATLHLKGRFGPYKRVKKYTFLTSV